MPIYHTSHASRESSEHKLKTIFPLLKFLWGLLKEIIWITPMMQVVLWFVLFLHALVSIWHYKTYWPMIFYSWWKTCDLKNRFKITNWMLQSKISYIANFMSKEATIVLNIYICIYTFAYYNICITVLHIHYIVLYSIWYITLHLEIYIILRKETINLLSHSHSFDV